ncbi:Uncharacterized protein TCM_045664 [Theobroma cacao]|uniref:Uncharacterized protein n=1 Tax=Theobroma cacao TaxID=3641 RepID=S1SI01_THECC|nr:Uncharacterized protein TCM_045664 [Theobroma cacao]
MFCIFFFCLSFGFCLALNFFTRMAQKRSKQSSSGSFDRSKFVSAYVLSRYHTSLINKVPISKRGIDIPILPYEEIHQMLQELHWQLFSNQPEAVVMLVVQEFYANAVKHVDGVAFVHSKQVPFHNQVINAFFGTPNIEKDECGQYLGDHQDCNEIILKLYVEGAQWKTSNGEPISFK